VKKVFSIFFVLLVGTNCVLKAQWIPINENLSGLISCLAVSPNGASGSNIYAGTSYGVYLSTDNGTNWTAVNDGLTNSLTYPYTYVNSLFVNNSNIYAGIYGGVFLSTNNGTSWTILNKGLTSLNVHSIAVNGSNIFAGTDSNGVFLSTDNGSSWKAVNNGLNNLNTQRYIYVNSLVVNGSNIFAGISEFVGVYLSTNSGANWNAVNNGLTSTFVYALTFAGTKLFAGTNGGVFRSTNNGADWNAVNDSLAANSVLSFAFRTNGAGGTNLFAGTDNGVFLSTNNGGKWIAANNGLTNTNISSIVLNDQYLFAGTSNGVWRRPLSEIITGIDNQQNNLPSNYSLQQNYPNPFNPTTTINFSIPKSGFVSIKVFDILGRKVTSLVNENKPVGNYKVEFNSSKLSSGIYFYRMESGSFSQTKKLIVLK
jgi:photosystem II stability/assembly factor-like uncharacterized protein